MQVKRSREADADLAFIWDYIAEQSEAAADRFVLDVQRRSEQLSLFPKRGSVREDLGPGARTLVVGRYLVVYIVDETAEVVHILRVVHGSRDLRGALRRA